jgi:hypothetical protein
MNKKLREKLDSWDLRSLILTIIIFSLGIFLFYYFSDFRNRLRNDDNENFKGQTRGVVISMEPLQRISQGRYGANISVDSYKVLYKYKVNNTEYSKIDYIPYSTVENQKFINKLMSRSPEENFFVKFDLENPNKSILIKNPQ